MFYWPQEFWVTNPPFLHVPVLPTFAPNLPLVLCPSSVMFHDILPSFFFFSLVPAPILQRQKSILDFFYLHLPEHTDVPVVSSYKNIRTKWASWSPKVSDHKMVFVISWTTFNAPGLFRSLFYCVVFYCTDSATSSGNPRFLNISFVWRFKVTHNMML